MPNMLLSKQPELFSWHCWATCAITLISSLLVHMSNWSVLALSRILFPEVDEHIYKTYARYLGPFTRRKGCVPIPGKPGES